MNHLRLLCGWPGPSWVFPASGAFMAVGSFLATMKVLDSDYVTWFVVTTAWHESLWSTGAIAAGGAAALGAAYFPKASLAAAPIRPRVNGGLFLIHGLALALWLCMGHALGLTPIHIAAAREATAGALALQGVVIGLSGLTALTVIGFCIGAAVRHWAIAPAVAAFAWAIMYLPYEPLFRPIGLLLPVRQWSSSARFEINPPTAVFAAVASVGICLLAASLAAWAGARRTVRREGKPLFVWLAAVVALVVTAFLWRPEMTVVDRPVGSVCQDVDDTRVCLHAANQPAMAQTAEVVSRIRAAGLSPVLRNVTDFDFSDHRLPLAGEALVKFDPSPRHRRFAARTISDQVALHVTESLTRNRCSLDSGNDDIAITDALFFRILKLAGFGELAEVMLGEPSSVVAQPLATMSSEQLTKFVDINQELVHSCRLSLAEFG